MDPTDSPTSCFTISSLLGLSESNMDDKLPKNVAPLRNTSKAGDTTMKNASESVISREREKERSQRGNKSASSKSTSNKSSSCMSSSCMCSSCKSSSCKSSSYKSSYKKRYRATFDKAQIYQMERIFLMNHYPDVAARSELSNNTGLMESQVQIWFQNRRAKWRKQHRKRGHDVPAIFGLGYPSHLLGHPGCEPWPGVFPYEYYNTNFWTCAQQQVAAINSSWAPTRHEKNDQEEFSCAVPLPESSDSFCSDSDGEEPPKNVEIRDDSSLQSLRLKAKEHLATMEREPKHSTV